MKKPAVEVDNVSMRFNMSQEKVDNLKEFAIKKVTGKISYKEFWALKDVSFKLQPGDHLGILGTNGAGKSTLLKTVAGVMKPTEGKVITRGKVVPMLELGAGFDKEYTGSENIFLYGAMLGYSKEFLEEKYDEIVTFSELGEFINMPIKNYSSGMRARLGFSVATIVDPEILILDEVLSVGDAKFKKKSLAKVQSMFDKGVTVLFVSHSLRQVRRICNKAIILDHGKIIKYGKIEEVALYYKQMLAINDGRDPDKVKLASVDKSIKEQRRERMQKLKADLADSNAKLEEALKEIERLKAQQQ
ncbi:MAG: ABC transporter ATP-binding protein [Lachnospiraceae bacterium]|nr:ABC transporter ATP-binding protein [Lachnospiraceae bacterium]